VSYLEISKLGGGVLCSHVLNSFASSPMHFLETQTCQLGLLTPPWAKESYHYALFQSEWP
jgi:hypothetical protein